MNENKTVGVRLEIPDYKQLVTIAASLNIQPSVLGRQLILQGLSANILDDQKNIISTLVHTAVAQAIKPVADRLAAISAKGALTAAASTFLSLYVLEEIGKIDSEVITELYAEAKKQAYIYVKETKAEE